MTSMTPDHAQTRDWTNGDSSAVQQAPLWMLSDDMHPSSTFSYTAPPAPYEPKPLTTVIPSDPLSFGEIMHHLESHQQSLQYFEANQSLDPEGPQAGAEVAMLIGKALQHGTHIIQPSALTTLILQDLSSLALNALVVSVSLPRLQLLYISRKRRFGESVADVHLDRFLGPMHQTLKVITLDGVEMVPEKGLQALSMCQGLEGLTLKLPSDFYPWLLYLLGSGNLPSLAQLGMTLQLSDKMDSSRVGALLDLLDCRPLLRQVELSVWRMPTDLHPLTTDKIKNLMQISRLNIHELYLTDPSLQGNVCDLEVAAAAAAEVTPASPAKRSRKPPSRSRPDQQRSHQAQSPGSRKRHPRVFQA
ncbi:uncharacterized protein SCHCODRAFT_02691932 [Schizophyllum commune H4-8]|uniref:Uncharacterized protein n=1 Tax=Schizophyllum commune (strain H4-8 / FGSC 9210) TaxID=578458 RepID=D8QDR0_SCHCM|nr:uncharacterized protein SCHCODRAFT_02691932 [Schizophyllum commune H4-8]KAI5888612.1 hypothetical protein SCHCODRAFT_02691932 [Schizophyllum commune H4-8]